MGTQEIDHEFVRRLRLCYVLILLIGLACIAFGRIYDVGFVFGLGLGVGVISGAMLVGTLFTRGL